MSFVFCECNVFFFELSFAFCGIIINQLLSQVKLFSKRHQTRGSLGLFGGIVIYTTRDG
jgi:hypothetical protein